MSKQDFSDRSTPSTAYNNDECIRIVMVGKTGVGKSATGNTILEKQCFKSECSPKSLTAHCEKVYGKVDGLKVAVIDTPGLFDTKYAEEKTTKDIVQSIAYASPGPHIFLIITTLNRFTEEEKQTVEKIQKIFGEEAYKYSMVLFTHGDQLKGKTIEEFLKDSEELQELVAKCNGQYHMFNNEVKDRSQVSKLLDKIRNINEQNGGSYYTNEMFQTVERAIKEEKQRILKEKEEQNLKEQEKLRKEIEKKYQQQLRKMEAEREENKLRATQAEREREEEKQQILKEKEEQNRKEQEKLKKEMEKKYQQQQKEELEKLKKAEREKQEKEKRIQREKEEQNRKEQEKREKNYQQQLREMEAEREENKLRAAQAEREREEEKQRILEEKEEEKEQKKKELKELMDAYEREMKEKMKQLKEEQDMQARREAEETPSFIQWLKAKFLQVLEKLF